MEKEFEFLEKWAIRALSYCLYGLVFLYFTVWVWKPAKPINYEVEEQVDVYKDDFNVSKTRDNNVHVTIYNPVEAQCDLDPLITADNSEINLKKLKQQKIRWAAVSRDLLAEVKFGEKIKVTGCKDKSLNGLWEVHDVMNSRYRNRVDLLFHQDIRNYGSYKAKLEFLRD